MGQVSLADSGVLHWPTNELILICLFAVFITANLFILRRRLHRLERHTARDLEEGGHDGKNPKKVPPHSACGLDEGTLGRGSFSVHHSQSEWDQVHSRFILA